MRVEYTRHEFGTPGHTRHSIEVPDRKGSWMLTHTGVRYYPLDPRPSEVSIIDIAHSLAMQCRYGGHCRDFYSVAEHSVYVSRLVPPQHALVALLHDATEAYVSDVPRPLKPYLTNYDEIEELNWEAISAALRVSMFVPACVHEVDTLICLTEMKRLMPGVDPAIEGAAPDVHIACLYPRDAEALFLARFAELTQRRS